MINYKRQLTNKTISTVSNMYKYKNVQGKLQSVSFIIEGDIARFHCTHEQINVNVLLCK